MRAPKKVIFPMLKKNYKTFAEKSGSGPRTSDVLPAKLYSDVPRKIARKTSSYKIAHVRRKQIVAFYSVRIPQRTFNRNVLPNTANDLECVHKRKPILVLALDLSAAFDALDNVFLEDVMKQRPGIEGEAQR